jgi:prepilin-type N-terminal cleavage/methylation domain-containing protein
MTYPGWASGGDGTCRADGLPARRRARSWPSGFTIIELLAVLLLMGVLLGLGIPALMKILARYKIHSSAQQLELLGRQARYESIKMNQPVTVVADTNRNSFYAYSGTIPGMPPYNLPHGPGDLPPLQRVAVWQLPRGVVLDLSGLSPACGAAICDVFSFSSDGQGKGGPVSLCGPGGGPPALPCQPLLLPPELQAVKVTLTQSTGRLAVQ